MGLIASRRFDLITTNRALDRIRRSGDTDALTPTSNFGLALTLALALKARPSMTSQFTPASILPVQWLRIGPEGGPKAQITDPYMGKYTCWELFKEQLLSIFRVLAGLYSMRLNFWAAARKTA